ncbi:MAG: glycosyltransferase family A protein [Patescibacteria group bacterium]
MAPETAVIIRAKNEERWIGAVLDALFRQTYKDFEVIIVDSGSSDRTLDVARNFPVTIFGIHPESFSYPYALNCGIARSRAIRFIAIISAHSVPISSTWLADGVEEVKQDTRVAGVYGFVYPLPDATVWDKIFQGWVYPIRRTILRKNQKIITRSGLGVLGFTNALIRKDLWEEHHFDEAYGAGGEDGEWAAYWLSRGYHVIREPKFSVMHSHYLNLFGWITQLKYWKSLAIPRPFRPLAFRKSKTHS